MKRLILLLLLAIPMFGQSNYPQLYVYGGANLLGGGYKPFSYVVGAMVQSNYPSAFWSTEALIIGNKKMDSDSGYTERVHAWGGYRRNDWLLGAGLSYSNLRTDIYSKHSWHPRFGAGKDINLGNSDMRLYGEYVLPGTDRLNGVQGIETSMIIPSTRNTSKHWFFRERLGVFEFHNIDHTSRGVFSELQLSIMYRF